MKYLVVSDNHGDREILVDLVTQYKGQVDAMFHCGDSELDPNDELWNNFVVVKGNCDYYNEFPQAVTKTIGNDTIFMTHGHLVNIKSGLNTIALKASEANATVVLFGHTHEIGCEMHRNTLFLNPGSIRQPRGPIQIKSYAIIESTSETYEIQYFERSHQPIRELRFLFRR